MRDATRISRIIEKLTKLWLKFPDMRLSQLFICITTPTERHTGTTAYDPFYLEDDSFEASLDKFSAEHVVE